MSRWEVWLVCPDCGRQVQALGALADSQAFTTIVTKGCDHDSTGGTPVEWRTHE